MICIFPDFCALSGLLVISSIKGEGTWDSVSISG
jgi:hypothetical protein